MRVPRTPFKSNNSSAPAGLKPLQSLGAHDKAPRPLRKSASSSSLESEAPAEHSSRFQQKLSQAQKRCSQAVVGPALGAFAAAQIVLITPDGEQTQHAHMLNHTPPTARTARLRGNPIAQVAESSGSQSQANGRSNDSSQRSERSQHRRPVNINPLAKVPFIGNRAPDFPPSCSRLTLAERAAAAASS